MSILNNNELDKSIYENVENVESEDIINDKIQKIMRQTDYSYEVAREKLKYYNNDEINVIKNYLGLETKIKPQIKSINQEIYKQLRIYLDNAMKDFREKQR